MRMLCNADVYCTDDARSRSHQRSVRTGSQAALCSHEHPPDQPGHAVHRSVGALFVLRPSCTDHPHGSHPGGRAQFEHCLSGQHVPGLSDVSEINSPRI
ncbi:unnamed protein product [Nesidiocoris tenuis]|uniref:Uncharacterized protein n=1 Tax=Nesidiocoris tenuis TaxID=355587 RepID=A0A6H5G946_9HEMI|nr:unnamed protein product [Nesidiocoris tenuis]